jgi:uncharacterized protein (DUF58 family)
LWRAARSALLLDVVKGFFHRSYWRFAGQTQWVQRRVTKAGWIVLGGLLASASLGMDAQASVAHQAFSFLAVLTAVALVAVMISRPRFGAERFLPQFGSAGTPLRYRLVFHNKTSRPQNGLALLEDLEDPRPTAKEYLATPEPGEEQRNPFDRAFGYYRWLWLMQQKRLGVARESSIPACPARGRVEIEMEVLPLRRGSLRFEGVTLGTPDPFGIFRGLRPLPLPGSVLILPRRYRLPLLDLPGTARYQQGGVALAASVGESEEFISLREYRPGDPLRHMHWKSWAKAGKPIVKEFQDEYFVRHALVLDTFTDEAYSDLFEEAVSMAASLALAVQTQESLLDLLLVENRAYCFTSGRGLAHAEQMLEILANVKVCRDAPFESLENLVFEHVSALSGCICVLLDWDEPRRRLIRSLKAIGVPTTVFLIIDSQAADVPPGEDVAADQFYVLRTGRIEEGLARI